MKTIKLKKISIRSVAAATFIVVVLAYAAAQVYLNRLMKDTGSLEQGRRLHFTVTWNEYVRGLKDYMKVHPGSERYVTEWLALPDWVDNDPEITAYIENGRGYLYAPSPAGLYTFVQSKTDDSRALGTSDRNAIRAAAVSYPKPEAVPSDRLVYVVNPVD